MAEPQGNSSNQMNQVSHYCSGFSPNFEVKKPTSIGENTYKSINKDTDRCFTESTDRAEKRRQLKLSFGSSGGGYGSGSSYQPFVCRTSQSGSNSTVDERLNSSPVRSRTGFSRSRLPFTQDLMPDKSREKFRMCQSIQSTGKLQVSPTLVYDFTSDDLQDLGEIGRGAFGTVNKMVHRTSNTVMAVKRIRSTVDEKEQKQLLMDLEVVMKSNECPCIVQFYGALFKEGDCWICMELMDTSLDKFYKFIYEKLNQRIPECILGKITVATVTALNYLKEKLAIIHRDVKPSNILLDKRGNIKLCDFGISGQLVDSIARTRDAGCRPYMAPERIDPHRARGYDVRSDVWSLGITLMEVATGHFPYPKWNSVFDQLNQVVQGDPPRLSPNDNGNHFTMEFVNFVNTCLIKEETQRPKYSKLLEHEFIVRSDQESVDVAHYVSNILDSMANNGATMFTMNQP
ncbi:dual specificity mitogen-activated protein kinase kinase 4-like isoform X1 [Schistocerca americana]|uniref:dual specificity mitogen-activated protein kinase kinase 4-like isoform X1 n=1 Tax=Schistocerca americana TaxID=7009 RepID=UPI001F4FE613|nr:dual specificity mitogen-activated protein kinase kinase 4-like isoform X1 [Schistocerca americana]XP_047108949.1 dual specificity mitogen-activated protein kinase kinase 4-like isoform X1 [Schistocerca piceifrons]XP_049801323.1 dual specificity mitogen-activated protein kinase kinase 4-like isoform X1 [Schistocerca nitens]XP_049853367.1 dual specificity mitogen-activated protein kinase kinase 4-like isoform X1 [Schistocerca gregaria]XP_049950742.1 dual specificity mitogen-activated protein 